MLTLWTGDARLACSADRAGVDRIGPDLESFGKAKRQQGQGTWISDHCIEHLPAIRDSLTHAALFVRTNPLHNNSRDELERMLDLGVTVFMLPNFTSITEVETYLSLVNGRAKVIPLLERVKVLPDLKRLVAITEITEIHIGLNDLALDLGIANRLAVLTSSVLIGLSVAICEAGIRLGVGGIARANDSRLPVPSDLVYAQYPRLGATAALISRSFAAEQLSPDQLRAEITNLRQRMNAWFASSEAELRHAYETLQACLLRAFAGINSASG